MWGTTTFRGDLYTKPAEASVALMLLQQFRQSDYVLASGSDQRLK